MDFELTRVRLTAQLTVCLLNTDEMTLLPLADSENALTATVISDLVYDSPVTSIAAQSRPLWLALPGAMRGEGGVPSGPNGGGGEARKLGELAVIKWGRVFILIFRSVWGDQRGTTC